MEYHPSQVRTWLADHQLFKCRNSNQGSVRPACPTYHSLLTVTQSSQLEALQKRTCKIIFGIDVSYQSLIDSGKIEALDARRKRLCLSFAKKAASNELFAEKWFPKKNRNNYNTRRQETYKLEKTRTERMRKNPVNYMIHELNKL